MIPEARSRPSVVVGVPLTGIPAKVVTKAYHLYALPAVGNRLRVATSWAVKGDQR
jgi:NADH dehydrogenase FAD-containing subunit